MDDNTETVGQNAELKIVGIFTDFSQVKIEVHGTDAAERILGDLTDQSGDDYLTEYLDYPDAAINQQRIPNWAPAQVSNPNNVSKENLGDYFETISLSSSEQNLEDGPEEILGDCLQQIVEGGSEPISEDCSDQILRDCPTQILEDCPGRILDDCPDQVLDDCPDQVLDDCPDQVLQDCPERRLEGCPEQRLEDCPKQISENEIHNIEANHTEGHEDGRNSPDYMGAEIKEEIEHFEGTDFTDFDEVPPESYHNDLPPEDIYHFRNKIILGTKPCLNTSDLSLEHEIKTEIEENVFKNNIETENLDAVVLLKDWGPHLEKSSSFCKKCGILFATPNILDFHNMTTHSFLVAVSKNIAKKSTSKPTVARKSTSVLAVKNKGNIARKSTGSCNNIMISKFCNHCNIVFPDHTALIKHLYELLPLKQFSCNICEAVFNTQSDLIEHNTIHLKTEKPKIKKEKVDTKKTQLKKKLVYEEDLKKKKPSSPKTVVDLIPMSVLFQCTKCKLHFLSSFAGLQHELNCTSGATSRKPAACTICKRKLRASDMNSHKKQHEICSKFQVYKITKNLFERTLCRCPKCGVHFNDYSIKKHLKSCGKLPTAHCRKCNILLPKSRMYSHLNRHIKQNLKAKDFIIVQHCIHNRGQKRKLEPATRPTKKIKIEFPVNKIKKEKLANKNLNKFLGRIKPLSNPPLLIKEEKDVNRKKLVDKIVYEKGSKSHTIIFFCNNCKLCAVRNWRGDYHLKKRCMTNSRKKEMCPDCGLLFNESTLPRHKKLHKMRKFTIHDMRFYHIATLKPTIPVMPAYPQCENCKITFFCKNILSEHICGEDYETCNVCSEKFHNSAFNAHMDFHKFIEKKQTKPKGEKIMPELIKKYKSLNMMWNIIYSCKKCDIVTDLYDKAVEHSQSHLHHEATSKNIKCYICNLKFDETCWSKHSDLHSRMNINGKDFKILVYDPKKLLTEDWFELFERLPEEQIRQITDKSLYGYERSTKMTLLKDGRSEFTLYCCSDCKVSCRSNEIDKHMKSSCKTPANFCKVCNVPFCDVQSLRSHEILHLKGVDKDEIRIVNFKKIKHDRKKSKKSTSLYVIYKCKNCSACVRCEHTRHRCPPRYRIDKCKKCNLFFTVNALVRHKEDHIKLPDFTLKNIKVVNFDLLNKRDSNEEEDDFEPVKKIKSAPKTVKQAKISKRKADTPISVKASKVPKYDSTKAETKTSKVFKCNCGLHFTSLKTIEKHVQTCSRNSDIISKENCSKCGLLFPTDVLVSHLCKHHSKNTKIVIEPYHKNKPDTSFDSVESTSECQIQTKRKTGSIQREKTKSVKPTKNCKVKLYKCSECNIYFMVQNTCYKHVYKAHQPIDPKHYIECKLCGLQFTIKALSQHISKHHQKEFSLDTVLVEEYHPPLGKGPPKIDIYVAAEKVQSLQVSSSIEERISNS